MRIAGRTIWLTLAVAALLGTGCAGKQATRDTTAPEPAARTPAPPAAEPAAPAMAAADTGAATPPVTEAAPRSSETASAVGAATAAEPARPATAVSTPTPSAAAKAAPAPTPPATAASAAAPVAAAKPAPVAKAAAAPASPPAAASKPTPAAQPASASAQAPATATTAPAAKADATAKAAEADSQAEGSERIAGRVELSAAPGQQLAAGEIASTVVYYVPARGAPRPKPGRHSIITRNKRFDPAVLVVAAGSTVSFPNQDEILHNVFSQTPGATFDLGLYGEGQSAETVFNRAVIVQIFCNVHHSMNTSVVVAPTPWFARVAADGSFTLEGLPPGPGTLSLWHPRAGLVARELSLPLAAPLRETLLASKPVMPAHLRKDGTSYRPPAR